jgi:hypothetical protein
MTRTKHVCSWRLIFASAVMIASVAGCSTTPPWSTRAAGQPAPVQDCTVFNISTPTRYACNGKVFTSYQLAKVREEETKKYNSGK